MYRKGWMWALVVSLLVLVAVTSCAQRPQSGSANGTPGGTQTPKKMKVVSSFNTLDNEYFINWDKGARQAAEALGIEYEAIITKGDQAKEIAALEQAIASGATMIASVPIGAQSVPAMAELANKYKVPLTITWDIPDWYTPLDAGEYFVAYLRPDWEEAAYKVAKRLFDAIGGKGKVIHITGLPGTTGDILVNNGFNRALKEYPDIKVIAEQPGNFNRVDSQKVMEDLIAAHPEFDAVFGQNDAVAIGAIAAMEAARHKLVPVTGMDGTKEAVDLIRQGKMTAPISAHPGWQAGYAVVRAFDAANGYKPRPAELMTITGTTIIDKSNADAYYQAMYASDKLPFDWRKMSRVLSPQDWDPQNELIAMNPLKIWANVKKPSNYNLPTAYQKAIDEGQLDEVTNEYKSHWKKKWW